MEITVEVKSLGQARLIQNMAEKLCAGSDKPRKWTGMGRDELMRRLMEEVEELRAADSYEAWDEAADVANFAAMVADRTHEA